MKSVFVKQAKMWFQWDNNVNSTQGARSSDRVKILTITEAKIIVVIYMILFRAEREGFEPSVPFGTHAFQACALDRYAISPPWIEF